MAQEFERRAHGVGARGAHLSKTAKDGGQPHSWRRKGGPAPRRHLFHDVEEEITGLGRAEQGSPLVATGGNRMEISGGRSSDADWWAQETDITELGAMSVTSGLSAIREQAVCGPWCPLVENCDEWGSLELEWRKRN